jgi:ankyrin repeat protein
MIAGLLCFSAHTGIAANSAIADAAKARDVAAVKAMLTNGGDVNAAQGDGMTALHWAATHGDAALTQMLLAAGANIRATTRLGGITALHIASQGGHANVVAALIAAGADANAATSTGATAVMLAARAGSTDTVTRLVETGAEVNAKEKAFGQTALMIAAGLDRADVVRLLLARGADWTTASSMVDLRSLTSVIDDGTGRPQQQQAGGGAALRGAAGQCRRGARAGRRWR